jgi:hypothetical protein
VKLEGKRPHGYLGINRMILKWINLAGDREKRSILVYMTTNLPVPQMSENFRLEERVMRKDSAVWIDLCSWVKRM